MNRFYIAFKKTFQFFIDYTIVISILCLIDGSQIFHFKGYNPFLTSFAYFIIFKIVWTMLEFILIKINKKCGLL